MKKILTRILAIALLVCLVIPFSACGKQGSAANALVGKWTISSFETAGIKLDLDKLASFGISSEDIEGLTGLALDIKEGGACVMEAMGESREGSYEEKDGQIKLKLADQELTLSSEKGELIMDLTDVIGFDIKAHFKK